MQGLIQEGNGEEFVRFSNDIEHAADLTPRQVRVRIMAAGVCGSDLSCVHGKYYMPTPLVPGHEAAGVVVEVGSAVSYCKVGDHVVLSTFANCGHCAVCEGGDPGNCGGLGGMRQSYVENGTPLYEFANLGAFVQETIVMENQAVPIPAEVPFSSAALIGCGVMTGAGAVFNRARVGPGETVAVIGAGGVGLNVIQAARLAGAAQIIAIDRAPAKERMAVDFGATDFILAEGDDFDAVTAVQELSGGGVNHAFEVVGSTRLLADAISMTRAGGNTCAVGVPDLTASVTYNFQSLHQNKSLLGIRAGGGRPRKDFRLIADLYLRGMFKLDELVSNTTGLDDIQSAFDALKAGAEARTVLLPNG
ncbi:MAG: alcohol dehydrogenase catalytic domain-containing protein [Acidimicrobiales bacterium]|mgnify:FL=1|jgi:S-(hydroxymethyl)glutathione dehydrogenase/alcohol dehydrogenase|nr:alcohol dehydrogenase catalytic domain-containing protein [Acidimicrobiales bacterium]